MNPEQEAAALRNVQNHTNAVAADKLELKLVLREDVWRCCGTRTPGITPR